MGLIMARLAVFAAALRSWAGQFSACFDPTGARHWRRIDGITRAIEEIKNPCGCRGFECLGQVACAHRLRFFCSAALVYKTIYETD
jgi:hypothetical protein